MATDRGDVLCQDLDYEPVVKGPQRRCIATHQIMAKDALLRFVLAPSGALTFDAVGKLPGRGLWLSPTHQALTAAREKGCFSRAARRKVKAPLDLETTVALALERQVLQALGLARRGGNLILGGAKVEKAFASGELSALWFATDNSDETQALWTKRLQQSGKSLPSVTVFSQETLAMALGRSAVAVMGLVPNKAIAKTSRDDVTIVTGDNIPVVPALGRGWHSLQNLLQKYFNLKPSLPKAG